MAISRFLHIFTTTLFLTAYSYTNIDAAQKNETKCEPTKEAIIIFQENKNLSVFFAEIQFDEKIAKQFPSIHSVAIAQSLAIYNRFSTQAIELTNKIKNFDNNKFTETFSTAFKKALNEYEPVRQKQIYKTDSTKNKLQQASNKHLTQKYFDKIYRIYDAILQKNYKINAYILPYLGKNCFEYTIGDNMLFIQNIQSDAETNIGIVAHECCHIAFNKISQELRARIDRFLDTDIFKNANIDNKIIDEIFATTFGNQIINDLIENKISNKAHDNIIINDLSQKLLPIAKYYYEKNLVLDENFFVEFSKIIENYYSNKH